MFLEAALSAAGLTLLDAICYDITLWQNEQEYQPTDAVSVTLPIPAEFGGEISAWHISGGTATNMGGSARTERSLLQQPTSANMRSSALLLSRDGRSSAQRSNTFLEKAGVLW